MKLVEGTRYRTRNSASFMPETFIEGTYIGIGDNRYGDFHNFVDDEGEWLFDIRVGYEHEVQEVKS